ncbi:hypothetical protein ACJJIR_04265 [Microbulbifer sp. SSSA008]|uniref:hypothetical protein n=1 Tax=Microbulbifer sp. SSSA008 TaxID=3243380 RepID=UPI004039D017
METKSVKAKIKGKLFFADFYYTASSPWRLKIEVPQIFNFSVEAEDLFEAFKLARDEADNIGLRFVCNGSRKNVYPSPMSRDMSGGIVAYELTMGQQALRKDVVRIFDETDEELSSTTDQEKYYKDWLASL